MTSAPTRPSELMRRARLLLSAWIRSGVCGPALAPALRGAARFIFATRTRPRVDMSDHPFGRVQSVSSWTTPSTTGHGGRRDCSIRRSARVPDQRLIAIDFAPTSPAVGNRARIGADVYSLTSPKLGAGPPL